MFKNRKSRLIFLAVVLLAAAALVWFGAARIKPTREQVNQTIVGLPASVGTFRRASADDRLVISRDFGPQTDFQTEWWYYTGNLTAADGRKFGYQLTFFRRALTGVDQRQARESDWAAEQVYMAHFTLTDAAGQQFRYFERFARGAAGLAGASVDGGFSVWLEDWSVRQTGDAAYQLHAAQDDIVVELALRDSKGVALQGLNGYSQKGTDPGNASLYFSQTRLVTKGSLQIGEQVFAVEGLSWMDREISTSALEVGVVGWDWFALQFSDGSDLMLYQLRRADGSVTEFSSGLLARPDGSTRLLRRDDFSVTATGSWRSPHTGGVYPSGWQISIPAEKIDLTVQPLLRDQELRVSFDYWEGAVDARGLLGGFMVNGSGYVELTGYAKSMGGQL